MLERCDCCGVYRGMTGTPEAGKVVRVEDAYTYAKAHLDEMPEEDKKEFVRFFFSSNWIEGDKDGSEI